MAAQRQRRLGEILLARGVIDEEQLRVLVAEQERTGRMLGELAVAMGHASSAHVSNALADQRGWAADAEETLQSSSSESLEALPPPAPTKQAPAPAIPATPLTQGEESDRPGINGLPPAAAAQHEEPRSEPPPAFAPGPQRQHAEGRPRIERPRRLELERHFILLPTSTGYELIERPGAAPAVGETIELPVTDGTTRYLVARNTRAPLPVGRLRCARLEAIH